MTNIEWADKTWNPIAGCSIVSPGCIHCYAMLMASRLEAMGQPKYAGLTKKVNGNAVWTGKVRLDEAALTLPLCWRKPARIFVNSMSDLFHEDVPDDWIDRVFAVTARCPQHQFLMLTKRAERMRDYMTDGQSAARRISEISKGTLIRWPLPNVWAGASVEDQARADERIPILLDTSAALRFISAEPLLGPVDISQWLGEAQHGTEERRERGVQGRHVWVAGDRPVGADLADAQQPREVDADSRSRDQATASGGRTAEVNRGILQRERQDYLEDRPWSTLDWIICGGESGPGARPCDVAWVRSLVAQCKAAGVACFVKQLGGNPAPIRIEAGSVKERLFLRDGKGGDPSEWPADLCVREWPA